MLSGAVAGIWDEENRQISIAWPSLSLPATADGITNALNPFEEWQMRGSSDSGWRLRKVDLERYWMALLSLERMGIRRLHDYGLGGGDLAIWGASSRGALLDRVLRKNRIQARFFVDNDPSKIGSKASGLAVRGLDGLSRYDGRLKIVLACSEQQKGFIRAQLEERGLETLLWDGG